MMQHDVPEGHCTIDVRVALIATPCCMAVLAAKMVQCTAPLVLPGP